MDKQLIKEYIDNQPIKIVSKLDLDKEKLEYDKINQLQSNRSITTPLQQSPKM